MLFSKADLQIKSADDFFEFLPIFVFVLLIKPFLVASYSLGFLMDQTGWLQRED